MATIAHIMQIVAATGYPKHSLWDFSFHLLPQPDLTARADGVRGSNKWFSGDRIGYASAYIFWRHEDPGFHDFVPAIRFFVQGYGDPFADAKALIVNDKDAFEVMPSAEDPYPYEDAQEGPVDKSRPGAVFDFFHQRFNADLSPAPDQLLHTFTVPAVSPLDSEVKWFYQLGGVVVAVHDNLGAVAKIIMSGMHPRYRYTVRGVPLA